MFIRMCCRVLSDTCICGRMSQDVFGRPPVSATRGIRPWVSTTPPSALGERLAQGEPPERLVLDPVGLGGKLEASWNCKNMPAGKSWPKDRNGSRMNTSLPRPRFLAAGGQDGPRRPGLRMLPVRRLWSGAPTSGCRARGRRGRPSSRCPPARARWGRAASPRAGRGRRSLVSKTRALADQGARPVHGHRARGSTSSSWGKAFSVTRGRGRFRSPRGPRGKLAAEGAGRGLQRGVNLGLAERVAEGGHHPV